MPCKTIRNVPRITKENTMEVQGSVIISDIEGDETRKVVKGGFADLHRPLKLHEKDDVPRILVQNFRRNTKPYKLYLVFVKFGTVTYLAVEGQQAVVEFSEKAPVNEVLKCNFLKIEGSHVNVQTLERFVHCEAKQFEFCVHPDLQNLGSEKHFKKYMKDIVKASSAESKPEEEKLICQTVEKIAQIAFRNCKAYPFGSRVTHLGLSGCDLDVFLDCGNMYNGNFEQERSDQQRIGETVNREILRSSDFGRTYKVWNARVPILKFFHIPTGTYGDIAFRNGLGIENTKLLNFLLSLDARLRPLLLFIKTWASLQGLRKATEMCHFSSYSLVMMVVFYLQGLPEPVLPTIHYLMDKDCGKRKTVIAGWPCGFTSDKNGVPKSKNTSTVLELAIGFFKFYQYFDFEWKMVCPLYGKAFEKQDLEEILDPESTVAHLFPAYVDYLKGHHHVEPLKTRSPVCVQDPFELSHNLTRGIKEDMHMKLISSCGLMYEKLSSFK